MIHEFIHLHHDFIHKRFLNTSCNSKLQVYEIMTAQNEFRNNCSIFLQVNQLLQIAKFNGTADDLLNPTSGTYSIGAVLSHIAAGTFTNTVGLVTQAPVISAQMATGANPNLVGISVNDFNAFRLLVGEAIDLLDKKIDEMLDVQALTCSIS